MLHPMFEHIRILARAGGGGSSSGSGGGGSSSGLGDSDAMMMISFIPAYLLGRFLRKRFLRSSQWVTMQAVGWGAVGVAVLILWLTLGLIGLYVGAGAATGMGAGLYAWFSKIRRSKQTVAALNRAANLDHIWDEQRILDRTQEIFMMYQHDWSVRSLENATSYMTKRYLHHSQLMIAALRQARRINDVQRPAIEEMTVVNVADSTNDADDYVTVGIIAKADDQLRDEVTGELLFRTNRPFTEYWKLKRIADQWYLDGIEQATADPSKQNGVLKELAEEHNLFYSLDWGNLLIPRRGQLFSSIRFDTADINNHIIGIYDHTYLLQVYTLDNSPRSYLITQTNVPKMYGNIVVRRRSWMPSFVPRGLHKITMEWGDFNKKYDVFASNSEGAASFELLHPAFMEKLEALPFNVNIEVVDNIVYLYAPQKHQLRSTDNYRSMLLLLAEVYKQMRL